jgi:hypothetical protein
VATPDALLNALRIPRQVVVHDQGTKLQVEALGGGLRGDHDHRLVAEGVHERGA